MARDFHLSVSADFLGHVKTRKLVRLLKDESAPLRLIQFWLWAAEFTADGNLSAVEAPEIESGAGYEGPEGLLLRAFIACGFVDETPDGLLIHNWMKPGRTGFALEAMEKSRARWRRSKGIKSRDCEEVTEDSARNPAGVPADSAVLHGSRFTVHGSQEFPPPACDPTAEEQAAAAPVAVSEAIASAAADARGTTLTQTALLALWKRVRDEETGTNSGLGSGGFGIKPERIRDAYETVIGEPEGPIVLEQSMRRFWRSVKGGQHSKASDCARNPGLAWACWMNDFAGDVLAARGAVPEIPKRDRAGPIGRDQPPPKAYATLNRRGP